MSYVIVTYGVTNAHSFFVGLGGNGRSSDECVTTGPFRVGVWKTVSGKCLKRAFNGNPPDADQVQITLKEPTFQKFELMLRVNIHEAMHCFISKPPAPHSMISCV